MDTLRKKNGNKCLILDSTGRKGSIDKINELWDGIKKTQVKK